MKKIIAIALVFAALCTCAVPASAFSWPSYGGGWGKDWWGSFPTTPTEPEVTEPVETSPEVTEPEVTEPVVTEPEPEVTEPEVTEPKPTEPKETEPKPDESDKTPSITGMGQDGYYTGNSDGIKDYIKALFNAGIYEAKFKGTYTVKEKIPLYEGMSVIGGTFIADPNYEGSIFAGWGNNIQLINVTLKAPALDKTPQIYVQNKKATSAKDSNVMGIFATDKKGIALINCVTDKIIPAKINNGSGKISGCTITDCSMFVWGTSVELLAENNTVSMCDTGLDYFYHVYYLDGNSKLTAKNNVIKCNTSVPLYDVYHLMTAGNDGTYRASGVVNGDVITGNFQHLIDCHYADLTLNNVVFDNTNTGAWCEIGNWGHVTYTYNNCTLDFIGSTNKAYEAGLDAKVVYNGCTIKKNSCLDRQRTYKNCDFNMNLSGQSLLSNNSDVYGCRFNVSGTPTGIAITSSATFDFAFVGNKVNFKNMNTHNYLLKCAKFTGEFANNVITGARTTQLWHTDRGNSYSTSINGVYVN